MIDLVAIRDGLAEGEFFVEYLPIISLSGGQCIGAEARNLHDFCNAGRIKPFEPRTRPDLIEGTHRFSPERHGVSGSV